MAESSAERHRQGVTRALSGHNDVSENPADQFASAKRLLDECKRTRPERLLNVSVSRLRLILSQRHPQHRRKTLLHLSMALLARFFHYGWIEDVQEVTMTLREVMKDEMALRRDRIVDDIIVRTKQGPRIDLEEQDALVSLMLFQLSGRRAGETVDVAIRACLAAKHSYRRDYPSSLSVLNCLVSSIMFKFYITSDTRLLDVAISELQAGFSACSPVDPYRYCNQIYLSAVLFTRCCYGQQTADYISAASLYLQADEGNQINLAGKAQLNKFNDTGSVAALQEAVALFHVSSALYLSDHLLGVESSAALANGLVHRFKRLGDGHDLEQAIVLYRETLRYRPYPHPLRHLSLSNLASALSERFSHAGRFSDLEESLSCYQELFTSALMPTQSRASFLVNFGTVLQKYFQQKPALDILGRSLNFYHKAISVLPPGHPRSVAFANLALAFQLQYEETSDAADLAKSINSIEEAVKLGDAVHLSQEHSMELASVYQSKFHLTGQLSDLDKAVEIYQDLLNLRSETEARPNNSDIFTNLGVALCTRFERTGLVENLENSIAWLRKAVQASQPSNANYPTYLFNLASAFHRKYLHGAQRDDLQDAILLYYKALGALPDGHRQRAICLANLTAAYYDQSQEKPERRLKDLEKSISLGREGLRSCSQTHILRFNLLINVGDALCEQFMELSNPNIDLIDESITLHREALVLSPPGTARRFISLNGLSIALFTRYQYNVESPSNNDLSESIKLSEAAFALLPPDHPDHAISSNLANALIIRHGVDHFTSVSDDLTRAVNLYRTSVQCQTASIVDRLHAAKAWAEHTDGVHDSTLEAYEWLIDLLHRLGSLDVDIRGRQEVL